MTAIKSCLVGAWMVPVTLAPEIPGTRDSELGTDRHDLLMSDGGLSHVLQ